MTRSTRDISKRPENRHKRIGDGAERIGDRPKRLDRRTKRPNVRSIALLETIAVLAIPVVAVGAYWGATGYYFSQDDFTFLARARGLEPYPAFLGAFGNRIISTRLYFQIMLGQFNMNADAYHWVSLLLHALNALLVYAVTRRWTGERVPALVAGFLFATFQLAFTAVFWISGVQDLLATTFLLASAFLWVARAGRPRLMVILSAAAFALSIMSKEVVVLFPGVIWLLAWAEGDWRPRRWVALAPHAALSAAMAALLLVHRAAVPQGSAYETGLTSKLWHNLSTYIVWTLDVVHPFEDRTAGLDYGAWKMALAASVLLFVLLGTARGRLARMQWAALGWYVLLLVPVLPLLHHTYLYYLYPAAPGVAILAGLTAQRLTSALTRRLGSRGRAAGWTFAIGAAAALCAAGWINVRTRETTYVEGNTQVPHNHVLRQAVLSKNAADSFLSMTIPPNADLLVISYFPTLAGDQEQTKESYFTDPKTSLMRRALRDGLLLKLLRPDVRRVEFAPQMEPKWEGRQCLLYVGLGRLMYLGTGADAWANLSMFHLRFSKRIEDVLRCGRRALELRPNHPEASLALGIALAEKGSGSEALDYLRAAAGPASSPAVRNEATQWLRRLGYGQ